MIFGNTVRKSLAMTALAAAASLAQAGPYYGVDYQAARIAFDGDVAVVATETFESVAKGLVSASNGTISLFDIAGGSLTQSSDLSPAKGARVTSATGNGRVNTTVGGAYWVESDASFAIFLGQDVEAFGVYGTDFGDFAGGLKIALYNNGSAVVPDVFTDGGTGSLIPQFTANGALTFLGYSSSAKFDEIRFMIAQDATSAESFDVYGFDDLIVGNLKTTPNPTPEPGSLALAGLALFAAGWARKTQRRA